MSDPLRRHFVVAVSEDHMEQLLTWQDDVWKLPVNDDDVVTAGDYLFVRRCALDRGGAVGFVIEITQVVDSSIWASPGGGLTRKVAIRGRRVL